MSARDRGRMLVVVSVLGLVALAGALAEGNLLAAAGLWLTTLLVSLWARAELRSAERERIRLRRERRREYYERRAPR